MLQLDGVLVPLVTPMSDDGGLDLAVVQQLIDFLRQAGVTGLVVAGTTGEGYALTLDERAKLLRRVADVIGGEIPLLLGVGGMSTEEAVQQAHQAREFGAAGLMIAAPAYALPSSGELVAHVRAIVAATSLPSVLYDYPARTGVSFDEPAVAELASDELVVGIKEASGDTSRLQWLSQYHSLVVVCGADAQALEYLRWGARSWIAGMANALPELHVQLLAAASDQRHDDAVHVNQSLAGVMRSLELGHYVAKVKYALAVRGIDVGTVRRPLLPLDADTGEEFARLVEQAVQS